MPCWGALVSACLERCLRPCALPLCDERSQACAVRLVFAWGVELGQLAALRVCANVCAGPSSAATSAIAHAKSVRVEVRRRVDLWIDREGGGAIVREWGQ